MVKAERLIFENFEEGVVDFPPTYKFDIDTDVYDSRYLIYSSYVYLTICQITLF